MRSLVLVMIVACGRPAEKAVAPVPVAMVDLSPGAFVVVEGVGVMQVKGPHDYEGKPGLKFSNERTGMGYVTDLASAKDHVRALISKAEAERRLKLLEDDTPVTDTRPAQARFVEEMRTLARGSDLERSRSSVRATRRRSRWRRWRSITSRRRCSRSSRRCWGSMSAR